MVSGFTTTPVRSLIKATRCCLQPLFDASPLVAEGRVFRERFELAQLVLVAEPVCPDPAADELGQPRIAEREPTPWRDAVGDIEKLLREDFIEVVQRGLLQQFAVQSGDSVDGVGADGGEVGHAHVAGTALINERHPSNAASSLGNLARTSSRKRRLIS